MAKLKDHILKEEEHRRMVLDCIEKELEMNRKVKHQRNSVKHQQEEFLYKPNAAMRTWQAPISEARAALKLNNYKHQSTQMWREDMPDLEGKALADAERQFDYNSWMGEHGIGEGTAQDEVMSGAITDILLAHNRSKHGIGD